MGAPADDLIEGPRCAAWVELKWSVQAARIREIGVDPDGCIVLGLYGGYADHRPPSDWFEDHFKVGHQNGAHPDYGVWIREPSGEESWLSSEEYLQRLPIGSPGGAYLPTWDDDDEH